MTATAEFTPQAKALPACLEYVLELRLRESPDAVVRVLTTLRRRRCEISAVDYAAGDRHRPGWLRVGVLVPPAMASSVPHWVGNLVDVLAVGVTER